MHVCSKNTVVITVFVINHKNKIVITKIAIFRKIRFVIRKITNQNYNTFVKTMFYKCKFTEFKEMHHTNPIFVKTLCPLYHS